MVKGWAARHRINVSRIFFVLVILLCVCAAPRFVHNEMFVLATRLVGFLAVVVATLGRLWSSLYLCGYKNRSVVDLGPFSIVRNPLYVFSFLGAIGIGLGTASMTITGLFVIFFVVFYPSVIASEENILEQKLGEPYLKYKQFNTSNSLRVSYRNFPCTEKAVNTQSISSKSMQHSWTLSGFMWHFS